MTIDAKISDIAITSSPWLMHTITAYLTGYHVSSPDFLGLPLPVGIMFGVGAESLGISLLSTANDNDEHNDHYSKDEDKVSHPKIAVRYYIFYVLAITVANVLPEISAGKSILRVVTIALFMMMSLPSAWIIAQRRKIEQVRAKYRRGDSNAGASSSIVAQIFGNLLAGSSNNGALTSSPPALYQQSGAWRVHCEQCNWSGRSDGYPSSDQAGRAIRAHESRVHR